MIDIKHLAELHASAAACNTFTDEYQRTVFDALPGLLAEVEELRKDKERLEATCGHLLKEIEQLYLENGDALDASSYCVLDLIQEVRALRQQVHDVQAAMIQVADFGGKASAEMSARIVELEAEIAELRKDKARMDWMEAHIKDIDAKDKDGLQIQFSTVRESLDAAMKGEPK